MNPAGFFSVRYGSSVKVRPRASIKRDEGKRREEKEGGKGKGRIKRVIGGN